MTNRKFVGFNLTLACFVATILVQALGVDHDLFLFGGKTLPSHSDMNGYGEVLSYFLMVKFYWLIFVIIRSYNVLMVSDKNMALLIDAAQKSGQSLELLVYLTDGLGDRATAKLCGNAASLPIYMKSRLSPYFSDSTTATSTETRL